MKFIEFIHCLNPYLGIERRALQTYFDNVQDMDLSPEEKLLMRMKALKAFRAHKYPGKYLKDNPMCGECLKEGKYRKAMGIKIDPITLNVRSVCEFHYSLKDRDIPKR